jgi:hypothetical protein
MPKLAAGAGNFPVKDSRQAFQKGVSAAAGHANPFETLVLLTSGLYSFQKGSPSAARKPLKRRDPLTPRFPVPEGVGSETVSE